MEVKKSEEGTRKGPWKAEEDEVLINHVKQHGPRDWSSIRSKGLLQRTGKSCRLRWVNKLRPNLKNGCKFTEDEERLVIELQAEFGNKWARIATYLTGRTDNDVKNFWSSRQKRLCRNPHSSSKTVPTKSQDHKNNVVLPQYHHSHQLIPSLEMLLSQQSDLKVELPLIKFETSQEFFTGTEFQNYIDAFQNLGDIDSQLGAETRSPVAPDHRFFEPFDQILDDHNSADPIGFFDEFPLNMYDHMESPNSNPPPFL